MKLIALCLFLAGLTVTAQDTYDFIQLAVKDGNATVFIDGTDRGPAPFFDGPLEPGIYQVRVTAPGFEDWSQAITIPSATALHKVKLVAATTGLSITSRPSGTTVWWRNQLLGRTPLALNAIPTGPQTIILVESGYETLHHAFHVTGKAQQEHAELIPSTASCVIRGLPPGATVLLDDVPRGTFAPAKPQLPGLVAPLVLDGFKKKKYTAVLRYRDVTSAPVVLDLSEGHGEVHLSVYAPDKEVVLRSGKKVRCMLLQEREDGSVLVATGNTPRDHRHIPAEKIERVQDIEQP